MIPLTLYKSTSKPAILIIGPPGTAKTTTVLGAFPRPLVIEIDNNISGAAKFLTDEKIDLSQILLDIPHLKADGTLVPRQDRWRTMTTNLKNALEKDNKESGGDFTKMKIQTIFVDSLTGLLEYALDEVRRQQGRAIGDDDKGTKDDPLQIQDWGAFGALMRHFFIKLRATNRILAVSGHTVTDKDDLGGFLKQFINCPGKFREEIAGLFTECWKTSIEKVGEDFVRMITTVPTPSARDDSLGLKSALRLGNKFKVDYKKINQALLS